MIKEKKFKYVGNTPNPTLRSVFGEFINKEQFGEKERMTFRALFRDQVNDTVLKSVGVFTNGMYQDMRPQHGAWEELEDSINRFKYSLLDITRASNEKNEFLCRVRIRVPTIDGFNHQPFAQPLPDSVKSHAIVSFYFGVCREFTTLIKKNKLVEEALEEFLKAEKNELSEIFDPDKVLPDVIRSLRLERLYNYVLEEGKLQPRHFYQAASGSIYRIEIEGYEALTSKDCGT